MSDKHNPQIDTSEAMVYQIRLKGHLGHQWTSWFEGLTITLEENGETLLTGMVVDQSALYGLLRKVRDLGLPLIAVNRVTPNRDDTPDVNQQPYGGIKMKIFVAGSSGATGQWLVMQLLERGQKVVTVVRSTARLPENLRNYENLAVTQASLLDLSDPELAQLVTGCDAVALCLGHNMTFNGIFGHPRRLVTDATRRLTMAVKANQPQAPVRFVLMNTVGNSNRDLNEPLSFPEKMVLGLLRTVLPPQADNEAAADYLRTAISRNDATIEWVVVRPDSLLNEDVVTEYMVHPSPTRSAIFNPGKTSRINVGHFMAELLTDDALWDKWKGQMPVIYNKI